MKYLVAFCVAATAACASQKEVTGPSKASITATGGTEVSRTDASRADEPLEIHPKCKQVVSCYNALARDLCLKSTEDCSASFKVTTPVDKPETCERLLDQAEETAKPFMADPRYKMPTECG